MLQLNISMFESNESKYWTNKHIDSNNILSVVLTISLIQLPGAGTINILCLCKLVRFLLSATYTLHLIFVSSTEYKYGLVTLQGAFTERETVSTIVLLVINSLVQLLLILKWYLLFCKTSNLNEEVNSTEPFPTVSVARLW